MNTLKLWNGRIDVEKVLIAATMTLMEISGFVFLICGILDIKPF